MMLPVSFVNERFMWLLGFSFLLQVVITGRVRL
jgi:hypothetical protein